MAKPYLDLKIDPRESRICADFVIGGRDSICTELLKSDVLYTLYNRSSRGETVVSSKRLLVMT